MKIEIEEAHDILGASISDKCTPLIIDDDIVSVSKIDRKLKFWNINSPEKDVSLLGHDKAVTALAASVGHPTCLCSCSVDKVILWYFKPMETQEKGRVPYGVTFGFDLGYIEYCTFSDDNTWLALCKEKEIWIIKIRLPSVDGENFDINHYGTIETNSMQGIICTFSPLNSDILVFVEDSNYFKVWNFKKLQLLYRSLKLCMHNITHCKFAKEPPYLLLGMSDGTVYIYSLRNDSIPYCIMKVSVGRDFVEPSGRPNTAGSNIVQGGYGNLNETVEVRDNSGEIGCIILNIYLFQRNETEVNENESVPGFSWNTDEILRSILAPGPLVLICCNLGIAVHDCNSWECKAILKTADMFPTNILGPKSLPFLSFMIISGETLNDLKCVLKMSLGKSDARQLKLKIVDEGSGNSEDIINTKEEILGVSPKKLSVISSVPVSSKSHLRMNPGGKEISNPYTSSHKNGKFSNMQSLKNGRKTKSSGYGLAPRGQLFQPLINKPKTLTQYTKIKRESGAALSCISGRTTTLLENDDPPSKAGRKYCIGKTTGTAMRLGASGDGLHVACSAVANEICVLKFDDPSPQKGADLIGHNSAISSLHFGLNSQWLVSSSKGDSTFKVWDWKNRKCIMDVDVNEHLKSNKLTHNKKEKPSLSQVKFYYMDKFLLIANGANLELFSHSLHETDIMDKPFDAKSCGKRVFRVKVPAQHMLCFSAGNQFHSYLALCSCSNRTVQVYDLNAEKFVVEFTDIHSRPAHHLRQMEGSQAMSHPPGMYDLFLTAAVCDSIKLWDLRSVRCVQKYCQHMNRAFTIGIDISPCGRFIATGSQDKCVYLYDTRKSDHYLAKLGGLGDVVMDVAFSPSKPLMVAAALNGCITSYST